MSDNAGLALRPYQQEALEHISEAAERGVRRQLGVAATGLGKGLVVGTPVLLSDGSWVPVEGLSEGDTVVGLDGAPTAVLGVFHRGPQPCYNVTIDGCVQITVDADHLWTVCRAREASDYSNASHTIDTATLFADQWRKNGAPKWALPITGPPRLGDVDLPIHPYVMGLLLGLGQIAPRSIRIKEKYLATKAWKHLHEPLILYRIGTVKDPKAWAIASRETFEDYPNPYSDLFAEWGLHGRKRATVFIPDLYFRASPGQRAELLAGLMDASGLLRNRVTYFEHPSATLVADVKRLVWSLGGSAGLHVTDEGTTGTDKKRSVSIRTSFCPFSEPKRRERWAASTWGRCVNRPITRIEEADVAETVCIKVAAEDGLFIIQDYIPTHNTIIFSHLVKQQERPSLILAHRDELISQAVDKLLQVWPEADVGVIKAERNEIDRQVVVGSIQTLARQSRRDKVPTDKFGLIVVDEAHRSKAVSYTNVLEHFRAGEEDGPLLLGVTATPDRGDGKGLIDVFDEIVFTYDMLWGIRSGYLADLRGIRVHLDADFSKAKIRKGDYDAGQVGQMLHDADAPAAIAEAWLTYAQGRRTLVFTPTVAVAQEVADEMVKNGVSAAMICGETPIEERRDLLRRYSAGEITVLANAQLLVEGFDDPATSCIIMARPTKSRAFYAQAIGRASRRHPDKKDALIIDVVGASAEHSLVTVPSLFGIKKRDAFEKGESTLAEAFQAQEDDDVRRGKLRAAEADLFRKVLDSPIAWVHFRTALAQTAYLCSLGSREAGSVLIEPVGTKGEEVDSGLLYRCCLQWEGGYAPEAERGLVAHPDGSQYRVLISNVDLEMAQGVGEDFIRKNGASALVDKNAAWRKRPPTERQVEAAAKWGLAVDPSWDAGDLSEALSSHIATKKARSRNRPAWVKHKAKRDRDVRDNG